jgi:hypothetical protein
VPAGIDVFEANTRNAEILRHFRKGERLSAFICSGRHLEEGAVN